MFPIDLHNSYSFSLRDSIMLQQKLMKSFASCQDVTVTGCCVWVCNWLFYAYQYLYTSVLHSSFSVAVT